MTRNFYLARLNSRETLADAKVVNYLYNLRRNGLKDLNKVLFYEPDLKIKDVIATGDYDDKGCLVAEVMRLLRE